MSTMIILSDEEKIELNIIVDDILVFAQDLAETKEERKLLIRFIKKSIGLRIPKGVEYALSILLERAENMELYELCPEIKEALE